MESCYKLVIRKAPALVPPASSSANVVVLITGGMVVVTVARDVLPVAGGVVTVLPAVVLVVGGRVELSSANTPHRNSILILSEHLRYKQTKQNRMQNDMP